MGRVGKGEEGEGVMWERQQEGEREKRGRGAETLSMTSLPKCPQQLPTKTAKLQAGASSSTGIFHLGVRNHV